MMTRKTSVSLTMRCMVLLVSFLLLSLCLIGCEKDPPDEDTDPDAPAGDPVSLFNEDGTLRYSLIRSDGAKADGKQAAIVVHRALEALGCENIDFTEDWYNPSQVSAEELSARYEILIGMTNRPESEEAYATLQKEYDFTIQVMGNKIVIIGFDEFTTLKAAEYFVTHYLEGENMSKITTELKYSATYEPLPEEIVLEDHSTGKTNPRIVKTLYTTEDVVVADIVVTEDGYAVNNKGMGDSTAGIQKALNDCAKAGGGTVYLPAGDYLITEQLTIPAYVVLRGDWQDPDFGNEYGTVLHLAVKSEDVMTDGTIRLGAAGGAYGLTIYYPQQSIDDVKPYPFTFYFSPAHQNKGNHAATVKNCTVINGYRGVGATVESEAGHEQLTVEGLRGTFLDIGVAIGYSSDVGTCSNISILPKYWGTFAAARGLTAVDDAKVKAYTRANTEGFRLSDVEWTEYIHVTITDCQIGVHIVPAVRIAFAGSFYDTVITDCDIAVLADDLDKRWGAQFSNSYLEGKEYAMVNRSSGMIKTAGTTMLGGLSGAIAVDTDPLMSYKIDTGVSYQKPAANLYVASFDKTGKTDISAQLQALLDEAGQTGGIVYLPGGNYLLDKPVVVPSGVELRGTASTANREQNGYGIGTRILTHYGLGGSDTDTALITLAKNSGVNGIRIAFTSNDSSIRDTAYAIRGTGSGVYVINSCVIAAGRGVDFAGCDNHLIKKLTSFCYINDIRVGGKNGTITGFLHNCTVRWRIGFKAEATEDPGNTALAGYQDGNYVARDYNTSIQVVDAEGQRIWNAFSYGVAHFIESINSKDTLAVNIGTDNIGDTTAQLVIRGGDFTAINVLRYNGHSYDVYDDPVVTLYARLAINDKTEDTLKLR